MSARIFSRAPAWVKERRKPTKEELAAAHFANGGGMGSAPTGGNSPDRLATDEPAAPIKIKRKEDFQR